MSTRAEVGAVEARAALLHRPRRIALERTTVGAPGPGEVRVRLEGCGVCASNLPVWEGRPWFDYPLAPGAPGHEGWGSVDAVGEGVADVTIGDRVAFLSYQAYGQYDIADAGTLVRLPSGLAGRPFPGEPLGCVANIFRRSRIAAGQSVAIVGVGFIGAALTALAVSAGARVTALARRPFALELAARFGASTLIRIDEEGRALGEARRRGEQGGCDCVIEAAGTQQTLDLATELTATRGRLVIAGFHQDGTRHVNLQQWNWRGIDVINAHERDPGEYRRGMREAVQLVSSGKLDLAALLTHRFPLEDTHAAFETLEQRPPGLVKAIIECG